MSERIVMVASSYPRYPGDSVGSFMEPIAQGIAARGHEVHLVAPWHPKWNRPKVDGGVHFHLFHYAPVASLNTFGYAEGMRADVRLRASAIAAAPLAMVAGWFKALRVAQKKRATIVHAHWVIPGGVIGAAAARSIPLVISLHGSDVFVAERHAAARVAARTAFGRARWVTACSEDLRRRALSLGADSNRSTVIPYGVDSARFKPDLQLRRLGREMLGIADNVPLVFAAGRLVAKKGFEYLIDAAAVLTARHPDLRVAIAGEGDLDAPLRARALAAGVGDRIQFLGVVPHHDVPTWLTAADVAVAPSVHDEAGNVDGLPNTVMEIMASGTPLVATPAGGIGAVATDGKTARLVPERDVRALAAAIDELLREPPMAHAIGREARNFVCRHHSWERVAEEFEAVYDRC
ncbi:MAG TPA: glycosyltransferase family 4 protein [Vicinamibacterales bacterium]|nr:glycosyltransferase family 4 protein [Vicinamibacterales bacterium]